MSHDIHAGPLSSGENPEHQAGPLPQAARPQRHRKTDRERRWERKRRRRVFEEVLGWILVPLILVGVFWGVKSGLNALGTSPTALFAGIKNAVNAAGGGKF